MHFVVCLMKKMHVDGKLCLLWMHMACNRWAKSSCKQGCFVVSLFSNLYTIWYNNSDLIIVPWIEFSASNECVVFKVSHGRFLAQTAYPMYSIAEKNDLVSWEKSSISILSSTSYSRWMFAQHRWRRKLFGVKHMAFKSNCSWPCNLVSTERG